MNKIRKLLIVNIEAIITSLLIWVIVQSFLIKMLMSVGIVGTVIRIITLVGIIACIVLFGNKYWQGSKMQYVIIFMDAIYTVLFINIFRNAMQRFYISSHEDSAVDGLLIIFWLAVCFVVISITLLISREKFVED
ncbi:MAG: hypothetical protein J6O60_08990 [Lachnospiraceae bacterium]|nr:hypothetical protein [Lachnospiraceae bacterium]